MELLSFKQVSVRFLGRISTQIEAVVQVGTPVRRFEPHT